MGLLGAGGAAAATVIALAATGSFSPDTSSALAAPTPIHVAVLLVNFSDDQRQPWTKEFISDQYNCCNSASGFGVADFYSKTSFGQLLLSADVYGWYPLQVSYAVDGCSISKVRDQADAAATADGVDLSTYTNIVYLWPSHTGCSAGTGTWPGMRSWVRVDPTTCPSVNGRCAGFHSFVHELGHNLGLNHAGLLSCGTFFSNSCTLDEYGDTFDAMGCCSPSLFSNYHRLQLGYIAPEQVRTITQSGDYVLGDATDPASLVYRIDDSRGQYLYFENRSLYSKYEGQEGYVDPGNLLVRRAPDFPLPTPPYSDANNPKSGVLPRLSLGESFTLPNADVTIGNTNWDGQNITIHVQYGPVAPPPPPPPPPPDPQCFDGKDNDSDGKIDYPADKQCRSVLDNDEKRK